MPSRQSYTEGRFVLSWVGSAGARDPIALTSQVKAMRDVFERGGHKPALMLVVVADEELETAVERVKEALDERTASRRAERAARQERGGEA